MPARAQAKHWVFTLNNYVDADQERLRSALGNLDCVYVVFGREVGESGTPHLQGYVAFSKRKSLSRVKVVAGDRAHCEIARGSPSEASEYCKKDGDFEEFGSLPGGQGSRTDLLGLADDIRKGASLKRLAEEHPSAYLRYSSGIAKMRSLYVPTRSGPPEIHCFIGRTGKGKTKRVYEFINRDKLWVHPGDRWFDGFDSHEAVLFDDFDGSWFKIDYLLKLLDRYVFQVPVKGAYTWWNPKHIFITSNKRPEDWYPNANEEHRRALMRRLNEFGTVELIE